MREAIAKKYVQFVDPNCARNVYKSSILDHWRYPNEKFTHFELHPAIKLSINAAGLPYIEYNPINRDTLGATHNRQRTQNDDFVTGIPYRNENLLATGSANTTVGVVDDHLQVRKYFTGAMVPVIISSLDGDNREDCIAASHAFAAAGGLGAVAHPRAVPGHGWVQALPPRVQ